MKAKRQKWKEAKAQMDQAIAQITGYPRVSGMVDVEDDWYPNYPNNQVQWAVMTGVGIKRFALGDEPLRIHTVFSGGDDFGINYVEVAHTWDEVIQIWQDAIKRVHDLCELAPLSQEFLLSEGFQRW